MGGLRYVTSASLPSRCASWLAELGSHRRARPLPELDTAALLLVDLQRYFGDPASHAFLPALDAVLPNCLRLAQSFRAAGRPVLATQHLDERDSSMTRWWNGRILPNDLMADLMPEVRELDTPVIAKDSYSAFQGTALERRLRDAGCETVVIAGVATHLCCETTARHAFVLGFDVVVVADGCASFDEELHLGSLRGLAHGVAVVSDTAGVGAGLGSEPRGRQGIQQRELADREAPNEGRSQLAIVGGGPAGIAAAVQALRSDVDLTLFEPGPLGGWARTADHIENYPGFPGGISGRRLIERFTAQLSAYALEPVTRRVEAISRDHETLTLTLDDGSQHRASTVIVATGTEGRDHPQIEGAVERADALPRRLKGKKIALVGGGEAAVDQALNVRRRGAEQVTVLARGSFRALPLLLDQARQLAIELWTESVLIAARPGVLGVEREGRQVELPVDHVVVCTGKVPRLPALPTNLGRVPPTNLGRVPRTDLVGCTAVPGLYVVGDARRGRYRQVAIACGDGVAAAMHAADYLRGAAWPDLEPSVEA